MANNTWIKASAGVWSDPTGWSLGHIPAKDELAVCDATSSNNLSIDVDPDCYGILMAAGYGGTVTQGAVDIHLGAGGFTQAGGIFTPESGHAFVCAGSFNHTAGSNTLGSNLNLVMTGDGTVVHLTIGTTSGIRTLDIEANVTIDYGFEGGSQGNGTVVAAGKTLTIANGVTYSQRMYTAASFTNNGTIAGQGTLKFKMYDADKTLALGNVTCPVVINLISGTTASRTVSLAANAVLGSSLLISSDHATYTVTLHHGSNYALQVAGTVTVGARGVLNQGTAQWSFGGYVQSGVSSAFYNWADLAVGTGGFNMSDGTFYANVAKKVTVTGGTYSQTGGGFNGDTLNLVVVDGTVTAVTSVLLSMSFFGNCIYSASSGKFTRGFANHGTLNITTDINVGRVTAFQVDNSGIVKGLLKIWLYGADVTINPGVGTNTQVWTRDSASGNSVATLQGDVEGLSVVRSDHATYTATLDTASHAVRTSGLSVAVRGVLLLRGSRVVSNGIVDTSAGSLDAGTSTYVSMGGTVKLASGQSLYDIEAPGVPLNILSDVPIVHSYKHALPTVLNGHSVPLTHPELEQWLNADQLLGARTPLITLMGAL